MGTKLEKNAIVHCDRCGEDYAASYKQCPFCDYKTRQEVDDVAYSNKRKPGRHLHKQKNYGGSFGGMEPVRIIGFVLSLILIIAAIYILVTAIGPLLRRDNPDAGKDSSVSTSTSTGGDVSTSNPQPPEGGDSSVITPIVHATAIRLDKSDVTLKANEKCNLNVTLTPSDCDDEITWSCSNESVATVSNEGVVTNVNQGGSTVVVTVTAKAGNVTAQCIVRCKPGANQSQGGTTTDPDTSTSSGTPTPMPSGTVGTVTGTTSGLLIRSGPGREHEAQDTAMNGAEVTILEDTGTGWYKIDYVGIGGKTKTGYVSKDYIQIK